MDIQQYLDKMIEIQSSLLEYIESQDEDEYFYEKFTKILTKNNIKNNIHELRLFFHLLCAISNNHHREPNFFNKIEKIIRTFAADIKKYYTDSEIFEIFKENKKIILFLIDEKIITIDETIKFLMKQQNKNDKNYFNFFFPQFLTEKIDNFKEKCQIGENDSYLCSLIRHDSVEEFISYVNQINLSLFRTKIKPSLFETNPFLIGKELSIIEYTTFFGSIQIFQYLILNKVELTPSLWKFVIHSNNAEMIHIIEDFHILPEDKEYEECLKEAIKCHHNDVVDYILINLIKDDHFAFKNEFVFDHNLSKYAFHYYNFKNLPNNFDHKYIFFYLCQYDYYTIVEDFLKNKEIDFNEKVVFFLIENFLIEFQFIFSNHISYFKSFE